MKTVIYASFMAFDSDVLINAPFVAAAEVHRGRNRPPHLGFHPIYPECVCESLHAVFHLQHSWI